MAQLHVWTFLLLQKTSKIFFCGQNSPSWFSSVSASFPFKGTHLLPGFGVHKTINDIPAIIICEGVHCQETLSILAIFFLKLPRAWFETSIITTVKPWPNCMYELFYFYKKLQKIFFCGQNLPSWFSSVSSSFLFLSWAPIYFPGLVFTKQLTMFQRSLFVKGCIVKSLYQFLPSSFSSCQGHDSNPRPLPLWNRGTTACMNFFTFTKNFKKEFFCGQNPPS